MDLVLVHPRYVFVLAFTCGTSPHNAQTKLHLSKSRAGKLGSRSRLELEIGVPLWESKPPLLIKPPPAAGL
jgi:hypothetical protein